jgi:hypothetical protein
MFQMQEHKSQIYNVNIEKNGNSKLEERIRKELEISPIVVINKNKIQRLNLLIFLMQFVNIQVAEAYLMKQPQLLDYSLLDIEAIKAEIEKQGIIGSRQGIEIKGAKGEGDDLDTDGETGDGESGNENGGASKSKSGIDEIEIDYKGKFAMYYARILFFSFLTDSKVKSLQEIISCIKENQNNVRITSNLNLDSKILSLFEKHINPFVLSELDYKIHNINTLANDLSIPPIDRASNAMKKFSRLSDSEIVTPEFVTDKIISMLPKKEISKTALLLDIASKQGEFVYSIYKRFGQDVANRFYSIPTSKIAYEFTRKVYKLLNLNDSLIEATYTSYDLINESTIIQKDTIKINKKNMKFNVIVGNPPYQQKEGGANSNTALPIYNQFVDLAKKHNPEYISLIIPTRWYAGGRGLDKFRDEMLNDTHISELHDFLNPELLFQDINIRGGICYFLWQKEYNNQKHLTQVYTYKEDLTPNVKLRSLKTKNSNILIRHSIGVGIIEKLSKNDAFESLSIHVSAAKAFGFRTYFISDKKFRESPNGLKEPITCFGRGNAVGYVKKSEVLSHKEWIDVWKVFVPESNNIGTELNDDNQNSFVGEPGTICTETFLVIGADLKLNKTSSKSLSKYLRTKFARFMHSLAKISQHGTSTTYQFVPLQDFSSKSDIDWSKSIVEIDKQLYKKYKLTKEEIEFIESMIKPMTE